MEKHRSSPEYRSMRKSLADERFYGDNPPEVAFLAPLGKRGFVTKDQESVESFHNMPEAFVAISKYTPGRADASQLAAVLDRATDVYWRDSDALSYFPMVRKDGKDLTITVFERYRSGDAYKRVLRRHASLR